MRRRAIVLVSCMLIGCGKGDTTGGGSSAGGAPSGSVAGGGAARGATVDACKPIAICDSFPAAHVDSLCGTQTATAVPEHVDSSIITDHCVYKGANGTSVAHVQRLCVTADFGGANNGKEMFDALRGSSSSRALLISVPGVPSRIA